MAGPGSWWIGWGVLAVLAATCVPRWCLRRARCGVKNEETAGAGAVEADGRACSSSYVLFSTGTIAYMTFTIAWLARGWRGGDCARRSLVVAGPRRDLLAVPVGRGRCVCGRGGRAMAMMMAVTFVATASALSADLRIGGSPCPRSRSAAPCSRWSPRRPHSCARIISPDRMAERRRRDDGRVRAGQDIGPVLSGTISDWSGNLAFALQSATAVLAVAAVLALFQRDLVALSSQHTKPMQGRSL